MFVLKHLQSSAWTFPPWGRCPDPTPHPPAKSGLKSLTASASTVSGSAAQEFNPVSNYICGINPGSFTVRITSCLDPSVNRNLTTLGQVSVGSFGLFAEDCYSDKISGLLTLVSSG